MSKMPRNPRAGKRFQPSEQDELYVGIDVHKHHHNVAIWNAATNSIVVHFTAPASCGAVATSLLPYREQILHVVYEAGPTGYSLARELLDAGYPCEVIAPSHVPNMPGESEKSDRTDAMLLAEWAGLDKLQPVYVPSVREDVDRGVLRRRATIVKECQRNKIRIKQTLLYHGIPEPDGLKHWSLRARAELRALELNEDVRIVLDGLLDDLEYYEGQRRKVEAHLKAKSTSERYADKVENLRTIPGVGLWTALVVTLELLCPQRFERKEEVAKAMGLAPKIRSSGLTRREMGRIRCGNEHIRRALVEASWQWIRRDPGARSKYRKLCANTGNAKKAITAMARRLGIIMWRMLVTGEPYRGMTEEQAAA